jgi:Cell division protein CrgA
MTTTLRQFAWCVPPIRPARQDDFREGPLVSSPMAKPAKRQVPGGRVTPKGGNSTATRPAASTRYTPPVPREVKVSPRWVPVLMFTLLALGLAVIFLNYLEVLPGSMSNAYLGAGLASICAGIITATQYR